MSCRQLEKLNYIESSTATYFEAFTMKGKKAI